MDIWCGWENRGCLRECYTKMEGKRPKGRPRTREVHQIRKDIEIRGGIGNKYKKIRTGRIDFSVIVFGNGLRMMTNILLYAGVM